MDVLLAIKPEFAEKILNGEKGYEFRRTSFRDSANISLIFLYASSPVSEIVGLFTSNRTIEAPPEELWNRFGGKSGIDDRNRFMDYFDGAETGFAIKVDETCKFEETISPDEVFEEFSAPMSFTYLDQKYADKLRSFVPPSFDDLTVATDLTQFEK